MFSNISAMWSSMPISHQLRRRLFLSAVAAVTVVAAQSFDQHHLSAPNLVQALTPDCQEVFLPLMHIRKGKLPSWVCCEWVMTKHLNEFYNTLGPKTSSTQLQLFCCVITMPLMLRFAYKSQIISYHQMNGYIRIIWGIAATCRRLGASEFR